MDDDDYQFTRRISGTTLLAPGRGVAQPNSSPKQSTGAKLHSAVPNSDRVVACSRGKSGSGSATGGGVCRGKPAQPQGVWLDLPGANLFLPQVEVCVGRSMALPL